MHVQAEDAGWKLRNACEPAITTLSSAFAPLKDRLPALRVESASSTEGNSLSELARRMKVKLSA